MSPTASVFYSCWALRGQLRSRLNRTPHRSAAPLRYGSAAARKGKERQWWRTGQGATERRAVSRGMLGAVGLVQPECASAMLGCRARRGVSFFQGRAVTFRGRLRNRVFPTAAVTVAEPGRAVLYAFLEVFRGAVRSELRGSAPAAH